jgi:starch synthase
VRPNNPARVKLGLVHHANQYLITDDYDNRQGISPIVEGYAAVLRLHEQYGIVANLHLSGTLVETIAWHCPWFLTLVRELRAKGVVSIIGGAYSESVLPLFDDEFNRRQLDEYLWLCRWHLGCAPEELRACWVPERIWSTERLAALLGSDRLANGGYRLVLLDDRALYPTGASYRGSPRAAFDASGPYGEAGTYWSRGSARASPPEVCRAYRIANAGGLIVAPISANLRYWVPPATDQHWRGLRDSVRLLRQDADAGTLLVYADDLERTAGVGGWDPAGLGRFEAFLDWLTRCRELEVVDLASWVTRCPTLAEREVQPSTFYELAQLWSAGEDYRGWSESPAWAVGRTALAAARAAIDRATAVGADDRLLALAWKHLLAAGYETGWQEPGPAGQVPTPWARAVASHARSCLVIANAACWFARPERPARAEERDIDQDGEDEVILSNEHLYAVICPPQGGRLTYLFARTADGAVLLVGNPTDDWNFQEELNRYMDWPPNHPGALADVGFEHDQYRVTDLRADETQAMMVVSNVEPGSRLLGARKRFVLAAGDSTLEICYHVPQDGSPSEIEACLSPDYYRLLREGRAAITSAEGPDWRGARTGPVAAWLGLEPGEGTMWVDPARPLAGHGLNLRVRAHASHFHLRLAGGDRDLDDHLAAPARPPLTAAHCPLGLQNTAPSGIAVLQETRR